MPVGVVKTQKQEHQWESAKEAAAKSKGKSVGSLSGDDWALVMHIFQNMKKSEDLEKSLKIPLPKPTKLAKVPGTPPSPTKPISSTAVKTPKSKKMPDASAKPSVFYKSESIHGNNGIDKLKNFLACRSNKNKVNNIK